MKAMILAAGLGTRLKPWTLEHPKALVPVDGVPMLERVIRKLKHQGFNEIVVNVHHFADQIIDYLHANDFGVNIQISDERNRLLDTGGGLLHAAGLLTGGPFLVHNVDILGNADLATLMKTHEDGGNMVTLLTSIRNSSRRLLFDMEGNLVGWHNLNTDEYKPSSACALTDVTAEAFSGIYVMGEEAMSELRRYADKKGEEVFPIMEFFLSSFDNLKIRRYRVDNLSLLDIGKPDTLAQASGLLRVIGDD